MLHICTYNICRYITCICIQYIICMILHITIHIWLFVNLPNVPVSLLFESTVEETLTYDQTKLCPVFCGPANGKVASLYACRCWLLVSVLSGWNDNSRAYLPFPSSSHLIIWPHCGLDHAQYMLGNDSWQL